MVVAYFLMTPYLIMGVCAKLTNIHIKHLTTLPILIRVLAPYGVLYIALLG